MRIKKYKKPNTPLQYKSELDWSPESWFSLRVAKPDGTKYTEEDVKILNSHIPEYLEIERNAKLNGSWLKMPDGSTWQYDPRSWVMMLSRAFRNNYSQLPWWTGQARWPTKFNYRNGEIETDKVTRTPYTNGTLWLSNSKEYGDAFAHYWDSKGKKPRSFIPSEENITGHNFLVAIPNLGNYRTLDPPEPGSYDHWTEMPYELVNGTIHRLSPRDMDYTRPEREVFDGKDTYLRMNWRKDRKDTLTDDVVEWSRLLGDDGVFLNTVYDGPKEVLELDENGKVIGHGDIEEPVNEFISLPGFTRRLKLIEGNNGNFDINDSYKYSYNKENKNITRAKFGNKLIPRKFQFGGFNRPIARLDNTRVVQLTPRMKILTSRKVARPSYNFGNQSDRVRYAMLRLTSEGKFTKNQAAALLGVYLDENGLNPKTVQGKEKAGRGVKGTRGTNEYGAGPWSWTGPLKKQLLKNMGYSEDTLFENLPFNVQVDGLIASTKSGPLKSYFDTLRKYNGESASLLATIMTGGVGYLRNWNNPTLEELRSAANNMQNAYIRTNGKSDYTLNAVLRRLDNMNTILTTY